ncbi:glycosyltransferase [Mangrovimonas cancribranchiae]|uniref:Glycosyltransferase n=1 Tax=Mangrovimonas cancribranchiae TaxID=3080055 RepID=A0AAU6NYS0_9FLAO
MLSILIPTYNYNALPLVQNIEQQINELGIAYEIICIDDNSNASFDKTNQQINYLKNCIFIKNSENLGSLGTRVNLAKKATYNWLLFLDADTLPKNSSFMACYINSLNKNFDVIFGGIDYKISHEKRFALREAFGKKRETVSALKRNKMPYKFVSSANFLIKKKVFLNTLENINKTAYGQDYLFGSLLKSKKTTIKHIDNTVYHLGLEENDVFLKKSKTAVKTLAKLYKANQIKEHDITLIKAYKTLRLFGLTRIFKIIITAFNKNIEKNLTGSSPSLLLFDLYRLGYFCNVTL